MITPSQDAADAIWLTTAASWPVIDFGPPGFPAYARLRFIPDPTGPGQRESDVAIPDDHPHDLTRAVEVLRRLGAFTSTPTVINFAAWDGYGELPPGARFDLPHRRFLLLQGSLADLPHWSSLPGPASSFPPALAWPADHAWCWASDVDPHWAGVGGSEAAIETLIASGLDVVRADPTARQPAYL